LKLIWFTDSHTEAGPHAKGQFRVQPFWPRPLEELYARLEKASAGADGIIFTGDAAHGGREDEFEHFFSMLGEIAGERPVFFVRGNHDVLDVDRGEVIARASRRVSKCFLEEGLHRFGSVDLILLNNYYLARDDAAVPISRADLYPVPAMTPQQEQLLESTLAAPSDRAAVVVVHCPTHALPGFQIDPQAFLMKGTRKYHDRMHRILDRHPRVRAVLSGHVHFDSTEISTHGRVHQSLASFIEYPFHIREVEIDGSNMRTRIVSLADEADIELTFPAAKTIG
jgi:3',5'-cyclic AMP phosphodiesterase CpdA